MNIRPGSIPALVAGMALLCAASWVNAADIVLKAAHNGFQGHPFDDGLLKLEEVLEARTGGAVDVQVFPAEQLGTEEQVTELVDLGTVAFNINGSAGISGFVPEAELLNLPFIFKGEDHFYRVIDGPVGNRIAQAIESRLDVIVLGWVYGGNRNLWNSKRPVLSPADMEGLKIRTMSSEVMVDSFNALGGQATPISFGELYSALQQGVVDGAEGDHIDLLGEKFYETVKYVSLTGHIFLPAVIIMSKKVYDDLPVTVQAAVWEAAAEAVAAERASYTEKDMAAQSELKDLGLQFDTVDSSVFQAALEGVYAKYADKVGGAALIEQVGRQ